MRMFYDSHKRRGRTATGLLLSYINHLFLRSSLKGLPGSLPGVANDAKPPCFCSSLRGHPSPGSLKR